MTDISEAGSLLRAGKISCRELTQQALARTQAIEHLNAFITVTDEQALRHADALDDELRRGVDRGPLHGIPIAHKDVFYTRGIRTTNGSAIFRDFVPDHDATVVERLQRAGAVSIGKLNQHELAYGITSNNPHFGPVRNPHNPDCIPGGSSGGSGVAVATGAVFCATGTDTGGSIRIPASFCGTVGLKPTFGRVSRYGCFPLGFTLDHMGPLTRTVEDAALVMEAIAGADGLDSTVRRPAGESFTFDRLENLAGVRIGVPENFYSKGLHPDVERAWRDALRRAEATGAELVAVTVPDPEGLVAVARAVLLAEAVASLETHLDKRELFGADVWALMEQGRQVPAYTYVNAQRIRRRFVAEYRALMDGIDVLITPTTPMPAPKIGENTVVIADRGEQDTRLLTTSFVRGINAVGLPAVSVPCGKSADGLPLGLQIIGRAWQERRLLAVAEALRMS